MITFSCYFTCLVIVSCIQFVVVISYFLLNTTALCSNWYLTWFYSVSTVHFSCCEKQLKSLLFFLHFLLYAFRLIGVFPMHWSFSYTCTIYLEFGQSLRAGLGAPLCLPLSWISFSLSSIKSFFLIFLKIIIYLFIHLFGCVGSSLPCEGLLQLRQAEATLHCGARAPHHCGLSCCGAQAPDAQAQ